MMKTRFLDAMGDALTLVRKSSLVEATALLRRSLPAGATVAVLAERGRRRAPDSPSVDQAELTQSAAASATGTGDTRGRAESFAPDFAFAPAPARRWARFCEPCAPDAPTCRRRR